jgi:hypothetical protein
LGFLVGDKDDFFAFVFAVELGCGHVRF